MSAKGSGISFYLFDFDDNIMFLTTPLILQNTVTKDIQEVSTGDFAVIHPQLGKSGDWADWNTFEETYKYFNDIPQENLEPGEQQYFVRDIKNAISENPENEKWQAPSWKLFQGACSIQAPLSIVTARGHSPETIKAGIRVLFEKNLIEKKPNYHTVFPVGNADVRHELGDTELKFTIPALKKKAIIKTVDDAIKHYGGNLPHRFGMSDDDPSNVRLIVTAMRDCKKKYPDNRFFVINTYEGEKVKLEIFPYDMPANTKMEMDGDALK
jgi:hypothetical protein